VCTFTKDSYVVLLKHLHTYECQLVCGKPVFKNVLIFPKYPRFLLEISENAPAFVRSIMGKHFFVFHNKKKEVIFICKLTELVRFCN
jgi:hypothetical protein